MDKLEILRHYFGHNTFRGGQAEIIDALLAGRDALAIMPTGGGKSLCYQVPALLLPGITLVISPLISLMKDQVSALTASGVPAAYINSSLSSEQLRSVYRKLRQGMYKLVYVAPERLMGDGFLSLCQSIDLSLVAVDEAHCISQWGQDFRPSYLKITDFLARLPRRPVLAAFTATATEAVRTDILRALALRDPLCLTTGFDRPNLYFDVLQPKKRMAALRQLIAERNGKSGIVYCATRAAVERVCSDLRAHGIAATRYHAGLSDEERRRNQDDFQFDRFPVMVATNAFGMGIDKSNVSFVIHCNMPKSMEAYYQEAGRAGRDGEPADCILLYSPADIVTARALLQTSAENSSLDEETRALVQQQDLQRLNCMIDYCKCTRCLRGAILDYFGQDHPEHCGSCGNCCAAFSVQDITVQAQMILSCITRVRQHLGYSVGMTLIVRTLHGSREARVLELGLNRLSTYGLMKNYSRDQIRSFIGALESQGYLTVHPAHATLELTERARSVLFGGQAVEMTARFEIAPKHQKAAPPAQEGPEGLIAALKALRLRLAREENVPAYVIFSNATLSDMAARQPRTDAEFRAVSGVGQKKAERYGSLFLAEIAAFLKQEET